MCPTVRKKGKSQGCARGCGRSRMTAAGTEAEEATVVEDEEATGVGE